MKSHKGIDLLPEEAQRQKRNRKLIYVLAATQVAIFLCLSLAVIGLRAIEGQAWEESGQLQQEINILRQSPEAEAAAQSREVLLYLAEEALFFDNAPTEFDSLWLEAILYTDAEHLTGLVYDGLNIQITGIVDEFSEIEAFRLRLIETEIFEDVGLGSIQSLEQGWFRFELRLVP